MIIMFCAFFSNFAQFSTNFNVIAYNSNVYEYFISYCDFWSMHFLNHSTDHCVRCLQDVFASSFRIDVRSNFGCFQRHRCSFCCYISGVAVAAAVVHVHGDGVSF